MKCYRLCGIGMFCTFIVKARFRFVVCCVLLTLFPVSEAPFPPLRRGVSGHTCFHLADQDAFIYLAVTLLDAR